MNLFILIFHKSVNYRHHKNKIEQRPGWQWDILEWCLHQAQDKKLQEMDFWGGLIIIMDFSICKIFHNVLFNNFCLYYVSLRNMFQKQNIFGSLQYIHLIKLCFSFILARAKKLLEVLNWSRASNVAAVSREVPMTKELLKYIKETLKLLILIFCRLQYQEVAHDYVLQLKNWLVSEAIVNSFDSWHGECFIFIGAKAEEG